jgi:hypothetical protein
MRMKPRPQPMSMTEKFFLTTAMRKKMFTKIRTDMMILEIINSPGEVI